jgi:ATP-dependent protease ClpP protease subunit
MYEIRLSGQIGKENTAAWFADALASAQGQQVRLLLNSGGGSVFTALEMADTLKTYPAPVVCRITGLAASAASYISTFCNSVEITDDSIYMLHFAAAGAYGDSETMDKLSGILKKIDSRLVAAYVAKSGRPEREIRELMQAESWFFGSEIIDNGFADILIPSEAPADRATAMARGKRQFAASFHRPTREEIAAHSGDLATLSADDLRAAQLAGMTVEDYQKYMPQAKTLSSAEEDIQAAKLAGMTLSDYRKYSAQMEARR